MVWKCSQDALQEEVKNEEVRIFRESPFYPDITTDFRTGDRGGASEQDLTVVPLAEKWFI